MNFILLFYLGFCFVYLVMSAPTTYYVPMHICVYVSYVCALCLCASADFLSGRWAVESSRK